MKFTLSTNIKNIEYNDFQYIVTSNSKRVLGSIVADYNSGIHCFTLVGTYGTGKSSFLAALERDLLQNTNVLIKKQELFNGYKKFVTLNIVGDYNSLSNLLSEELSSNSNNSKEFFTKLENKVKKHKDNNEFLLLVIDEFGKILEHAANNNPERELYFLQQLAEFVNSPKCDNILLLTTLHQNFGTYSKKLTEQQRNEWEKVKGRFKEIVFSEPVEQLLHLAAAQIEKTSKKIISEENFETLFNLAKQTKFINNDLEISVAKKLYPLDIFSAVVLTQSIQRYGQNERSLFSFLSSKDNNSINNFEPTATLTYNLSNVYDYIIYNFYSYLSEVNADSANWRALRVALERVEGFLAIEKVENASKLVKTIGLCNLFENSINFSENSLTQYAKLALDIENSKEIIKELVNLKIIRFANYKQQFILFDGTDVNIEDEMLKAATDVAMLNDIVNYLNEYFENKVVQANAYYYRTGTQRFFEFQLSNEAQTTFLQNSSDGCINLVFAESKEQIIETSKNCKNAILYVYFNNISELKNHIHEILKLEYVRKSIDEDRIADKELQNLISYEKDLLNQALNHSLTTLSKNIEWYYNGEKKTVKSQSDFNKLLSEVCDDVYSKTPIIKNELFNRDKVGGQISVPRVILINTLIDDESVMKEDLGFEKEMFQPQKSIYYTLLKSTGIHREINGVYTLAEPTSEVITDLWNACEEFLESTIEKQRKLGDLIKILKSAPFKLKQGFLDFWIPIYLVIKKQDYSLYDSNDTYIRNLNREVLDILQKSPDNFKIKKFAIDGVKIDFFNQYRNFINLEDKELITQDSFLKTIKPFLKFYNDLNDFAKTTQNFDNPKTATFRNVLAKAKDPEKTFFEDLPAVFGFKNENLTKNQEFMQQYQDYIKDSIRELRSCYANLINKIESNVIDILGLKSSDYTEYKTKIDNCFKTVKANLLSAKQKSFLNRLLLQQTDKTLFYESICYVVFDKPLVKIKDNEVNLLIDNLKHLFTTLTKFVDISKIAKTNSNSEIYQFELVSTKGTVNPQSYVLPDNQKEKTNELEAKINQILTGDENLDVCTLLRILKSKVKNG